MNDVLDDLRFQRAVARLHRLGPRAVCELLAEVSAVYAIRHPIEEAVERYITRLDYEALVAVGGDAMPAAPLHLVEPEP